MCNCTNELNNAEAKIEQALDILFRYGQIDGEHHKAWVIDQLVHILAGDKYQEWVEIYIGDGEDTYDWEEGIAP